MTSHRDIDKGWAWLVLFASYFNLLLCSGLAFVAGMFQLEFLKEFQGSVAFTSWVTALFSSLMQLGGPLSSLIANCFNCRVSVMAGGALMAVGLFISSMTDSLEILFVTFGIVAGVGLGLTYTASIIVINYFFLDRRTLVTGFAFSASGLGIVITPQVSQLLFDNFTWRESLTIIGGVAAQVCVMGALMSSVHETKSKKRFCRTSAEEDRGIDVEYRFEDDEEDSTAIQMQPLTFADDQREFSVSVTLESSRIKTRKEVDTAACQECAQGPNCDSHSVVQRQRLSSDSYSHQSMKRTQRSGSDPTVAEKHHLTNSALAEIRRPSPLAKPIDLADNHSHTRGFKTVTKPRSESHHDLEVTSRSRARELRNGAIFQSHQELIRSPIKTCHTGSHPNLMHRVLKATSGSIGVSRTSIASRAMGSNGHVAVISRNPSLLGLVPSTTTLDIVLTSVQHRRSNSLLESTVLLTEVPQTDKTAKSEQLLEKGDHSEGLIVCPEFKKFPPLYRNVRFWLLCLSLFISNAGCSAFNIHFPGFLKSRGLTDQELTSILSVNGFSLLIGRCLCAALANAVKGNDLLLFWALHIMGGLCVCFMPLFGHSFVSLVIMIYGTGSYYGTSYALLPPITIEMVGLSNLASAFGIEMVFAGIGYFVSPPLAGLLVDLTNNYEYSVYWGGALLVAGGMIILTIPLLGYHPSHVILDDSQKTSCDDDVDNTVLKSTRPKGSEL